MRDSVKSWFDSPRGQRVAWYLYDFGNSGYAAVVILAVYSVYFQGAVVGGPEGSRLWGVAVALAMFTTAVIAPVLGAMADRLAIKKRMLALFTIMSCVATACLFFVGPGDIFIGMVFFILAEIGYRSAQVFYNAILPEIAPRAQIGRVSGNGWAIGSIGSITCLALVLPLIFLFSGVFIIQLTMVFTAVYFAIFTLPLFIYVRETAIPKPLKHGDSIIRLGFSQLASTFRRAGQYRQFLKFLFAFFFFNDGVMIALNFAAIIGAVLYGFTREQLIILIILAQAAGVFGAWFFGHLTDRMGAKSALFCSMALMVFAAVWMLLNDEPFRFYLIGSLTGLAVSGLQATSRGMVAKLVPAEQTAEFYGLFAIAGRSSSVIGPALFGWVAADAAAAYLRGGMGAVEAEQAGIRLAIYIIFGFLAMGALVLAFVREEPAELSPPKATGTRRDRNLNVDSA